MHCLYILIQFHVVAWSSCQSFSDSPDWWITSYHYCSAWSTSVSAPLFSSAIRLCRPDQNILHISLWLLTCFFHLLLFILTSAVVSRPNSFTHHNVFPNSIVLSPHPNPPFSFLLCEQWLWGRTPGGPSGASPHFTRLKETSSASLNFLQDVLLHVCLCILSQLTITDIFPVIFCQFALTSGLSLLLTLECQLLSASLWATHTHTQMPFSSVPWPRGPVPAMGLQLPPTLDRPLFLMLFTLPVIKFSIIQFSCSSPCSTLYKCCSLCIHCFPVKNPDKWVLRPWAVEAAVPHLQMQLRGLRVRVLRHHSSGSLLADLPLPSAISSGWRAPSAGTQRGGTSPVVFTACLSFTCHKVCYALAF